MIAAFNTRCNFFVTVFPVNRDWPVPARFCSSTCTARQLVGGGKRQCRFFFKLIHFLSLNQRKNTNASATTLHPLHKRTTTQNNLFQKLEVDGKPVGECLRPSTSATDACTLVLRTQTDRQPENIMPPVARAAEEPNSNDTLQYNVRKSVT